MRQNQFSGWLTQFAEENYKKIEAGYFERLKQLIEKQNKQTYATIDDALDDFCKRLSLDRPDKGVLTAKLIASLEATAEVVPSSPFEKKIEEIENEQKYPVKRKESDTTKSQIAREVNLEMGEQLGKGVGVMPPAASKISKLKGLSLNKKAFLLDPEVFANKESFKKAIMKEFENGYGEEWIEELKKEGGNLVRNYIGEIYNPYKEKLEIALNNLKTIPQNEDQIPTLWMETSDAFEDMARGNFEGVRFVLDQLLAFLNQ